MDANKSVYCGEIVPNLKSHKGITLLGPGLHRLHQQDSVSVTHCGKLRYRAPHIYWVDDKKAHYIPKRGDFVIGTVTKRLGDVYRIDIGASESAVLSSLSFEGATKKQKPDLQIGDIVCARVVNAHRQMEPELMCTDSYFKAGRLGPLDSNQDCYVFCVSRHFALRLLDVEQPLLRFFGQRYKFEIVIGVNGRIWVSVKKSPETVMRIVRSLQYLDGKSDEFIQNYCCMGKTVKV